MDIGTIEGKKLRELLAQEEISAIKYIPYNTEIVLYFYEKEGEQGCWNLWNLEILKEAKVSVVFKLIASFLRGEKEVQAIKIAAQNYSSKNFFDEENSLKEFLAQFY